MVTAPVASVVRSYQWTPRSDDKSVYLIVRLAFSDPLFLSQVRFKEPGGTSFEVAYAGDDLTKNLATMLMETRVAPVFRTVGAARLITPKA